ncbi:MAG: hypothetical protein HXX80_07225 [Nitrososphaerales archaeon]|nr:hypothetical protein [Nitrososphaerales archaeon]
MNFRYNFLSFFEKRKEALLARIEKVTWKPISRESLQEFDGEQDEEEDFLEEGEQP